VITERTPLGHRYRLPGPVRHYAAEALAASGERDCLHARHAAYYTALAERAVPHLAGADRLLWLDRLTAERDNVRGALQWSLQHGEHDEGRRLAEALSPCWEARGDLSERQRWLHDVQTGQRSEAIVALPGCNTG
jgi:predicted ATPase